MEVTSPAALAAAATAAVSSIVLPTGFSIQNGLPASAAATPISRCSMLGAQIDTTSTWGSASIVAIFLFIDAAFLGFPVLSTMLNGGAFPVVALLLVAGLIAAGVGLLQGRRWGWYLAMVMIALSVVLDLLRGNLLGLVIDALIIFLLTRPAIRAKFGVR